MLARALEWAFAWLLPIVVGCLALYFVGAASQALDHSLRATAVDLALSVIFFVIFWNLITTPTK